VVFLLEPTRSAQVPRDHLGDNPVTVHGILPVVSHAGGVVNPEFLGVAKRFCR